MPRQRQERDDFGERVAIARKTNGWTTQELADRTESLSKAVVSNIETGRKKPTLDEALALSIALEVPLLSLVVDLTRPGADTGWKWTAASGEKRVVHNWDLVILLGGHPGTLKAHDHSTASRAAAGSVMEAIADYNTALNEAAALTKTIAEGAEPQNASEYEIQEGTRWRLSALVDRIAVVAGRMDDLGIERHASEKDIVREASKHKAAELDLPRPDELGWDVDAAYADYERRSDSGERPETP